MSLAAETGNGRVSELTELRRILAEAIDGYEYPRDLPPLAARYMEVSAELARLDGTNADAATVTNLADRIARNRRKRANG